MEETFENAEKREQSSPRRVDALDGTSRIRNIYKCKGGTGHKEVVRVLYDKNKISYKELLFLYFRDRPDEEDGMFLDGGEQYRAPYTSTAYSKKRSFGGDRSDGKFERA